MNERFRRHSVELGSQCECPDWINVAVLSNDGGPDWKGPKTMARRLCILASSFALLVLGACQAAPLPPVDPLIGPWGGQHVALELTHEGGTLEYDCAAGAISEPVRPDASGHFSVHGTHRPGHGGPERVGEEAQVLPAEYDGSVNGKHMTLSVHILSSGLLLGPFTLERGAAPVLMRCL